MPLYTYATKGGKVIERLFPRGEAPERIGHYVRFITLPMMIMKGEGWTRPAFFKQHKAKNGKQLSYLGSNPSHVSWDTVHKIMAESDRNAKKAQDAKINRIKNMALEYL